MLIGTVAVGFTIHILIYHLPLLCCVCCARAKNGPSLFLSSLILSQSPILSILSTHFLSNQLYHLLSLSFHLGFFWLTTLDKCYRGGDGGGRRLGGGESLQITCTNTYFSVLVSSEKSHLIDTQMCREFRGMSLNDTKQTLAVIVSHKLCLGELS